MAQNLIDGSGISIQSFSDIVSAIVNGTPEVPGLISIYGSDINVGSNTPDGNLVNILALSKEDVLQLCVDLYDSFDPDQAVGTALDNVSQLCGIAREGGSYTETNVVITTSQAVSLYGLDDTSVTPFTVSDSSGNNFYLKTSTSLASGTSATLLFRAAEVGYIQVAVNTITNIITITPGVDTANNPTSPTLVGQDQETDAIFRIRRQRSVAIPAQGAYYGLYAGLLTITGLEQAIIHPNYGTATDGYGVPAHTIWVITSGGSSTDIGNMIYKYLNLGCGMKGTTSINVEQVDGTFFTASYDVAVSQALHISMHLSSKSSASIDTSAVKSYLAANYVLGIYEPADITTIDALIHQYSSDLVATSLGVSLSTSSYGSSVLPSAYINRLQVSGSNITITT